MRQRTERINTYIVTTDDDDKGIFHVFELRIRMNEFDHRSFLSLLKQQRERPEKFRPEFVMPFSLLLRQR